MRVSYDTRTGTKQTMMWSWTFEVWVRVFVLHFFFFSCFRVSFGPFFCGTKTSRCTKVVYSLMCRFWREDVCYTGFVLFRRTNEQILRYSIGKSTKQCNKLLEHSRDFWNRDWYTHKRTVEKGSGFESQLRTVYGTFGMVWHGGISIVGILVPRMQSGNRLLDVETKLPAFFRLPTVFKEIIWPREC